MSGSSARGDCPSATLNTAQSPSPGGVRTAPLRVCHIVSGDLWAGAEVQVYMLLRNLLALPGIELSCIVLNDGTLRRKLAQAGVNVVVIPESQHGLRALVRETTAQVKLWQVQVLHSHRYKENVVAVLAARRCGVPVLVRSQHGAPEPFSGWKRMKQLGAHLLERAVSHGRTGALIGVSAELSARLAAEMPNTRVENITNGIDSSLVHSDLTAEAARARLGIPASAFVVGLAARLEPVKRVDLFLEAAKHAAGLRPDSLFVVVGDGSELQRARVLAERLGLPPHVRFLGHRDDVYDVMRAFDVFTLSSDHEGMPMVLLEAMELGVPVVARNVGGIPEAVRQGVSGILVDSGDPRELAKSWLTLAGDPALRRRFAENGRKIVAERFSAATNAARMAALYRELLGAR